MAWRSCILGQPQILLTLPAVLGAASWCRCPVPGGVASARHLPAVPQPAPPAPLWAPRRSCGSRGDSQSPPPTRLGPAHPFSTSLFQPFDSLCSNCVELFSGPRVDPCISGHPLARPLPALVFPLPSLARLFRLLRVEWSAGKKPALCLGRVGCPIVLRQGPGCLVTAEGLEPSLSVRAGGRRDRGSGAELGCPSRSRCLPCAHLGPALHSEPGPCGQ